SANLSISIKENLLDTLIKFTSDSGRSYRFDLLRNGNSNSQIRVSITDSITGLPISAAACSLKSSILYTAVTDTLGRFGTALDSGKYTLSINKPGYKRILNYPITLLNSDTLKINLRLSPLSIVSIKNEDNKILLSPGSFFTPKASIEYNDGSIADASELILNWSFYPSGSAIYDTKSNQIKASTVPSSLKAICSYNNFTDTMWITIADRYSISPSADAYVQGGTTSSTNYGKQTVLVIKKSTDPNYTRYSYFKFTLPALSDLSLIDSVRFRLMGADTLKLAANLDAVIHSTDTNTWSEDSITWDRRPAFIRALDTAVLSYDVSKLYYWNITMAVRDAIAEKKSSITLAVASGREHSEWISFWSKEAAKSITLRSPMLELFLHPQLLSSADSAVNLMPEDILSVSPNPFNPSTFISFYTNNKNAPSTLTIHNIKGEKIWQYKASSGFSGKKSICWNGKNMYGKPVAAGLYYCTFVNGKNRKSTLLALVR
ncbi:MAG: carboxypeptidase regulatory-like domain-containing protein, partial [Fibrobacteres bacterium]|nr:carboxypeptidase regulatory-like domain-containing protein [Fibrobacterota bacterium]